MDSTKIDHENLWIKWRELIKMLVLKSNTTNTCNPAVPSKPATTRRHIKFSKNVDNFWTKVDEVNKLNVPN